MEPRPMCRCCNPAFMSSDEEWDDDMWEDPRAAAPQEESGKFELDREWQARREQHWNTGYRDGKEAGKQQVVQAAFDEGFSKGAQAGNEWGLLLGRITCLHSLHRKLGSHGCATAKTLRDRMRSLNQAALLSFSTLTAPQPPRPAAASAASQPAAEQQDALEALLNPIQPLAVSGPISQSSQPHPGSEAPLASQAHPALAAQGLPAANGSAHANPATANGSASAHDHLAAQQAPAGLSNGGGRLGFRSGLLQPGLSQLGGDDGRSQTGRQAANGLALPATSAAAPAAITDPAGHAGVANGGSHQQMGDPASEPVMEKALVADAPVSMSSPSAPASGNSGENGGAYTGRRVKAGTGLRSASNGVEADVLMGALARALQGPGARGLSENQAFKAAEVRQLVQDVQQYLQTEDGESQ